MVFSYKQEGNLRNYLQKNSKLTLKDRITILKYLCVSLHDIHEKDLIHRDLHSGNVLIEGSGCFITDLGLCGPVDDESSNKIYGIVSYIAPEVLQGGKTTKESDVYSVGMLMWEIFAGHPPFDDVAHDCHLIFQICEGLQPQILPEMPDDYAQIMKKCWDVNPFKRPTIVEIEMFAKDKLKEIYKNGDLEEKEKNMIDFNNDNNSNVNSNSSNSSINSSSSDSLQQAHKTHPLAYHTSRILNDEIVKSKNLKSNDSLLSNLDINFII